MGGEQDDHGLARRNLRYHPGMDPNDLQQRTTPDGVAPLLRAMWHAQQGDWARAHEITQAISTREAAWVTPTCTDRKVIWEMRSTGTSVREEPCRS